MKLTLWVGVINGRMISVTSWPMYHELWWLLWLWDPRRLIQRLCRLFTEKMNLMILFAWFSISRLNGLNVILWRVLWTLEKCHSAVGLVSLLAKKRAYLFLSSHFKFSLSLHNSFLSYLVLIFSIFSLPLLYLLLSSLSIQLNISMSVRLQLSLSLELYLV